MKLIRHILSHIFSITFLIAVVCVFYYRSFLLPENIVGKIDGYVQEVYPPAVNFASKRDYFWSIKGERIVSFDDLTFFKKDEKVATNSHSESATEIVSQTETKSEQQSEFVNEVESEKPGVVSNENELKKEAETIVTEKEKPLLLTKQLADPVKVIEKVEEMPVVTQDKNTSSERELLIYARNAFNHGNLAQSEKFYLELTQLDYDTADIFGELGNVYYAQGKWDKAGQAYYEAAVRLIAEGKREQVSYLHRVIEGLNTEQAEKLAQVMMRR